MQHIEFMGSKVINYPNAFAGYPVYHSMYDDFVWMKLFGDPGFHRHVAGTIITSP